MHLLITPSHCIILLQPFIQYRSSLYMTFQTSSEMSLAFLCVEAEPIILITNVNVAACCTYSLCVPKRHHYSNIWSSSCFVSLSIPSSDLWTNSEYRSNFGGKFTIQTQISKFEMAILLKTIKEEEDQLNQHKILRDAIIVRIWKCEA